MGISFVAQGYRQVQRGKRQSGKWHRVHHAGSETVVREIYRGWQIEISSRTVGVTVRRDQFSATIRQGAAQHYLSGLGSKASALASARRHVDLHAGHDAPQRSLSGPHQGSGSAASQDE